MKFNVYFSNGRILSTFDMKTAFQACDMPELVDAVTGICPEGEEELLWGEFPNDFPMRPDENETECEYMYIVKVRTPEHKRKVLRFACYKDQFDSAYVDLKTQLRSNDDKWDESGSRLSKAVFYKLDDGKWIQYCAMDFCSMSYS